jgi:hypothetical protein
MSDVAGSRLGRTMNLLVFVLRVRGTNATVADSDSALTFGVSVNSSTEALVGAQVCQATLPCMYRQQVLVFIEVVGGQCRVEEARFLLQLLLLHQRIP